MLVHEQLRRFEGSIVAATRQGSGGGSGGGSGAAGGGLFHEGSASALGHFGYDAGDSQSWTFSEALLYSVTVITTIGEFRSCFRFRFRFRICTFTFAPTHPKYLSPLDLCLVFISVLAEQNCLL